MTCAGSSLRRPLRNSSAQPACGVLIPPVKSRPGLHHLVAGIMHRRRRVIDAAHQRKLVRQLRHVRKDLRDLDVRVVRLDRLERSANFPRRVRLRVPRVHLARRAEIENHDAGALVLALVHRPHGAQAIEERQRKPDRAQRPGMEEIAPR